MKNWILLREDGSVAGQVVTEGERPHRDNPDGLYRELEVERHGELLHETFDVESMEWVSDPEKLSNGHHHAECDKLSKADLVNRIVQLEARIARLERNK